MKVANELHVLLLNRAQELRVVKGAVSRMADESEKPRDRVLASGL